MSNTLEQILKNLQEIEQMNQLLTQQGLIETIRKLQTWQTNRLLATHDDLWNSKRFRPPMQFFADEIYGPKDFSARDVELARAVPKMAKVIPEKGLQSLQTAIRLNSLSLELDLALAQHLGNDTLSRDSYFECYRQSGSLAQRAEQIQLLETLSFDLPGVVNTPGISLVLKLSRKPAKLAGVGVLHAFLEDGFNSFKKVGDVNDFINPVITREKEMMNALFSASGLTENPLPDVGSL